MEELEENPERPCPTEHSSDPDVSRGSRTWLRLQETLVTHCSGRLP